MGWLGNTVRTGGARSTLANVAFLDVALVFGAFLVSLSVHECAHAWTASTLGDPTGRALGRVSLNPVRHIDPFGTLLLPLFLIVQAYQAGLPARATFGYAKPVPYNPYVLRNPALGMTLISAAGPLSNIVIAIVSAGVVGLLSRSGAYDSTVGLRLLEILVPLNVRLAVFNLIPIAPLDGSGILAGVLPRGFSRAMAGLEQYGFLVLIALAASGLLDRITGPVEAALLEPLGVLARRSFLG